MTNMQQHNSIFQLITSCINTTIGIKTAVWKCRSVALALNTGILCSMSVIAAPIYSVRDLGSLGGSYGIPVSINNSGQVVGDALTTGDVALRATLFSTSGGVNVDLGTLGGTHSYTTGINNNGQVVGYAQTTTAVFRATLFNVSAGGSIDLGSLGGNGSIATGINDRGQIIGYSELANKISHATLFNTGGAPNLDLTPLDSGFSAALAINNSGQIVGHSNGNRAAMFSSTGGVNIDLGTLGGYASSAVAINDSGQIVGWSNVTGDAFQHATLFGTAGGSNTDLGTLSGTSSYATAINSAGQVVGYDSGGNDAFLWVSGLMTSLDTLIESASKWDLIYALDINDQGQIAAYGHDRDSGALHGLLLSSIPTNQVAEPNGITLVVIGILGAAYTRIRKLRSSKVQRINFAKRNKTRHCP